MDQEGNQLTPQVDFFLNVKDAKLSDDFFQFIFDKQPSVGTVALSLLYGGVFFPLQATALASDDSWEEWILTFALLAASSTVAISGLWLSYIQLQLKRNNVFEPSFHRLIPILQASFIICSTVYEVLQPSTVLYTEICNHYAPTIQDFLCTYDDKVAFYVLLMAINVIPVVTMVCLRESRLYLILSSVIIHTVSFVSYAAEDQPDLCPLFIFWGVIIGMLCLELHRSHLDKFFQHQRLQEALDNIERMQASDRANELRHMIGNVAHDLKTPLASIATGVEMITFTATECAELVKALMKNPSKHDEKRLEDLDTLHSHILNIQQTLQTAHNTHAFMLMTINRCLDYTKASKGIALTPKYEPIPLLSILQIPLHCMQHIQERIGVTLESIDASIGPRIVTDKQWLLENVLCLLSNAVKYSNEGTVTLTVSLERNLDADKQLLSFAVADRGAGLSDDQMSTLFHPNKQAQRLAGGTGLGLYCLAKRMDALGGKYGVRKRNDGSTGLVIWFAIPYQLPANSAIADKKEKEQQQQPQSSEETHSPSLSLSLPKQPSRSSLTSLTTTNTTNNDTKNNSHSSNTFHASSSDRSARNHNPPENKETSRDLLPEHSKPLVKEPMLPTPPITPIDDSLSPPVPPPPPASLTAATPSTNSSTTTNTTSAKNEKWKILLVDDSLMITKMVGMMLRRQGHEVTLAENGLVAFQQVERQAFDLVLMDLQMPVMDGLEATRRIRVLDKQQQRHQLILGMSANSDQETMEQAFAAGIDNFIPKPFNIDSFLQIARKLIPASTSTEGGS